MSMRRHLVAGLFAASLYAPPLLALPISGTYHTEAGSVVEYCLDLSCQTIPVLGEVEVWINPSDPDATTLLIKALLFDTAGHFLVGHDLVTKPLSDEVSVSFDLLPSASLAWSYRFFADGSLIWRGEHHEFNWSAEDNEFHSPQVSTRLDDVLLHVIPEPFSGWLVGAGLLFFCVSRRFTSP